MRWRRKRLALQRRKERAAVARFERDMSDMVNALAEYCHCCGVCSQDICGSVLQGGPCERICRCGEEDAEDYYLDEDPEQRDATDGE